jgi:truncated hemoglobin YjbI
MRETYNTEAIIASSLENVTKLKDQLAKIEQLREDVNKTILLAREIPEHFNRLGDNLAAISTDFILKTDDTLKEQILEFNSKINDLQQRIEQIDKIDFKEKFENANEQFYNNVTEQVTEKINLFDKARESYEDLYTGFLDKLNVNLEQKMRLLGELKSGLDTTHQKLEGEVERIHKVDLEEHFNKHDKRLSEIFGATNNINFSLLAISNQTVIFQEKLFSLEQKVSEVNKNITDLQSIISNDMKAVKSSQDLMFKKQDSNYKILLILVLAAILSTVILHFL